MPSLHCEALALQHDDMRWPKERQLRARPSVRDLALAYEVLFGLPTVH